MFYWKKNWDKLQLKLKERLKDESCPEVHSKIWKKTVKVESYNPENPESKYSTLKGTYERYLKIEVLIL